MKKSLFLFVLALLPIMASADPVKIGDLWYNLISKGSIAEVTHSPTGYSGDITIPPSVPYNGVNYTVTTIDINAFSDCTALTSVTIPSSIKTIGQVAFMNCTSLTAVYITDLKAWCEISFVDNPVSYAHHLYINGVEIKDLIIPNGVTFISNKAFEGCSNLTSVTIPDGVLSIGTSAFYECSGLVSVSMSNSVTTMGDGAFYDCSSLNSITLSNNLTTIGNNAFSGCNNLSTISIPNSIQSIGYSAFSNCSGLTSVILGNNLTSIGTHAFSNCIGLSSIMIPNSVTFIGDYAFCYCTGLTSFTFPNGITTIGSGVLSDCTNLTSVTIPSNVIIIRDESFARCDNLADVYCKPENVTTDPAPIDALYTEVNAFKDSYQESITVHVPSASIAAYKAIEPWKYFKDVVALGGGGTSTTKCDKPTISYNSATGTIDFTCTTDGVDFVSSVTSADVNSYTGSTINLTLKFTVSVYATKAGLDNSDEATKDIEIVIGDMDGDGNVNAADIVKLVDKVMNP